MQSPPRKPKGSPARKPIESPFLDSRDLAVEVNERAGDSAWAMWSEVARQHEAGFAETQPATRPPEDPQYAATAPMGLPTAVDTRPAEDTRPPGTPGSRTPTLEQLMVTARRNNRVCPVPARWRELYEALGGQGAMHLPVPPIDPRAWAGIPPLQKRLVLREQLEWAQRQGKLDRVALFMQGLEEADWFHMGDA